MNFVLQRATRRFRVKLRDASKTLAPTECAEGFPGLTFETDVPEAPRRRYERYLFCVELARAVCEKYAHARTRSGSDYAAAIEMEFLLIKEEFESRAEREWATRHATSRLQAMARSSTSAPASLE